MKKGLLISLISCIVFLAASASARAEISMTQVTANAYEDAFPQIKGDYLVWQGNVGGDWEIFLYNVATGEGPFQIIDNGYGDISPQTDGNYVVWVGFSQSGGEIFLYDILSGWTTQITDDAKVDSPPQIANGRVVWTSQEVTDSVEPGEIFLYDTATGATEQLTDNILDDSSPRINDESVIWVQTDEGGNITLFIHDLATGDTAPVPEGLVWMDSPQAKVLTRHDGSDREIVVYGRDSRTYHQVTNNSLQDRHPSISGNYVAWMADGEIFLADVLDLGLAARPATDVGQRSFTAHWNPPIVGADSYRLDVSTSDDFSFYVPGYENLDVGNTTSHMLTRLKPDTMYYFRVRAVLGGSTSGNSNSVAVMTPARRQVPPAVFLLLLADQAS